MPSITPIKTTAPLGSIGDPINVTAVSAGTAVTIHQITNSKWERISISARNNHSSAIDVYLRVKNGTVTGAWEKYTIDAIDTQKTDTYLWLDKIVGNTTSGVIECYVSNSVGALLKGYTIIED